MLLVPGLADLEKIRKI